MNRDTAVALVVSLCLLGVSIYWGAQLFKRTDLEIKRRLERKDD